MKESMNDKAGITDDNEPKTFEAIFIYLGMSESEEDWGKRCDQIKAKNGGEYPALWSIYLPKIQELYSLLFGDGNDQE